MRVFPLSILNLPSAVSRLGAQECCPRNWTANWVFSPALHWLRGNRVEPLCGTTPLLWRRTHSYVTRCFSVTFTRTAPPLPARLSSQFKTTFASLFWDHTVMFSRSKKRRDDGSREVGWCPKVWRLHGARREALQRRVIYCLEVFLCNLISLARDSSL